MRESVTLHCNGPIGNDREVDQLLHPSCFYARPADVVADDLLTVDERRSILCSWASDACAVESNPALRHPPSAAAPATFDEIMDALLQLDRLKTSSLAGGPSSRWPRHRPARCIDATCAEATNQHALTELSRIQQSQA